VAELGRDADPFMLHLYAALAEKERRLIAERTRPASRAKLTAPSVDYRRRRCRLRRALAVITGFAGRFSTPARRLAAMPWIGHRKSGNQ
jgi:DNA invertase Pin-like site-specific DNA recombinase